ncbi:MAG TPA: UDP-N-acetylmuramate dehydrogenase, partial [Friedmanniella sp.]
MTAAVLGGLPARHGVPISSYTTLRVGGPARDLVEVTSTHELVEVVRALDAAGEPVLVLGGGSNLLVGDAGFGGTVVLVSTRGVSQDVASCSGAVATVAAGEPWDPFVALTVANGWTGMEALSGIPGSVGATPIQNVGAYGAEVGQHITTVRTLDRSTGKVRTLFAVECGFGYRTSVFKTHPGRYVVLDVTFQLRLASLSAPVRYAELARVLGVEVGARVPAAQVRDAVLALRASKGMVLDD